MSEVKGVNQVDKELLDQLKDISMEEVAKTIFLVAHEEFNLNNFNLFSFYRIMFSMELKLINDGIVDSEEKEKELEKELNKLSQAFVNRCVIDLLDKEMAKRSKGVK